MQHCTLTRYIRKRQKSGIHFALRMSPLAYSRSAVMSSPSPLLCHCLSVQVQVASLLIARDMQRGSINTGRLGTAAPGKCEGERETAQGDWLCPVSLSARRRWQIYVHCLKKPKNPNNCSRIKQSKGMGCQDSATTWPRIPFWPISTFPHALGSSCLYYLVLGFLNLGFGKWRVAGCNASYITFFSAVGHIHMSWPQ